MSRIRWFKYLFGDSQLVSALEEAIKQEQIILDEVQMPKSAKKIELGNAIKSCRDHFPKGFPCSKCKIVIPQNFIFAIEDPTQMRTLFEGVCSCGNHEDLGEINLKGVTRFKSYPLLPGESDKVDPDERWGEI